MSEATAGADGFKGGGDGDRMPPLRTMPGARQDTFSLDEGQVILQWPSQLSQTSFDDFKDWIDLQLRKIKRSIQ